MNFLEVVLGLFRLLAGVTWQTRDFTCSVSDDRCPCTFDSPWLFMTAQLPVYKKILVPAFLLSPWAFKPVSLSRWSLFALLSWSIKVPIFLNLFTLVESYWPFKNIYFCWFLFLCFFGCVNVNHTFLQKGVFFFISI